MNEFKNTCRSLVIPVQLFLTALLIPIINSFAAIPPSFTYQGSIKVSGVPVTGTYSIELKITNSDGSQVYWTSGAQNIQVKEGLYRTEIAPTGIDWNNTQPYMETRVNGNTLLPREKLTAVPYALLAKDLSGGTTVQGDMKVIGKITIPDGSATNPSISFSSETNSGLYRYGPGQVVMSITGNPQYNFLSTQFSPGTDGTMRLGSPSARWKEIWSLNGTILTSNSKEKKEIREILMDNSAPQLLPVSAASISANARSISSSPSGINVPRGIVFKWKNPSSPETANADYISFMGDDLPPEAHGLKEDGTRDPDTYYVNAVIGILCAKVKQQDDQIKQLKASILKLQISGR